MGSFGSFILALVAVVLSRTSDVVWKLEHRNSNSEMFQKKLIDAQRKITENYQNFNESLPEIYCSLRKEESKVFVFKDTLSIIEEGLFAD